MKHVFLAALLGCSPLFAQKSVTFDSLELHGFLDGVMETKLRDLHIAGAVVTVVHHGRTIFAKGYGLGDVARQVPVFPDSTLFRIGSVSKLFVWVSVMQLVQQGKLDLHTDVNRYLTGLQIPDTYPQPVTLANLMSHTAGFEDRLISLFAKDESQLRPLADILNEKFPARVRPPGVHASYSNHGTALASVIVEQVSGMNFNTYVEKNILGNLVMNRTTFRQPVPASLPATPSLGYTWQGVDFQEKPFEFVPLYPAGAASATGRDMANLMIALLNQGRLAPYRLLDSAVWKNMLTPLHRHHPQVNPARHGIMDLSQNGVEIVGHGGATFWFHSLVALFPGQQLGIFVSANTDRGAGVGNQLLEEFTDHYFPEQELRQPIRTDTDQLGQFTGTYLSNRHAVADLTSVISLFSPLRISYADSGRLRVQTGNDQFYIVPLDSLLFREERSSQTLAFQKNKGRVTHLFLGGLPIVAFDKVTGWPAPDTQLLVFIAVLLTAVLTLLFWPLTSLLRRGYQPLLRTRQSLPYLAKIFAWSNFLLWLIFVGGFALLAGDPKVIVYGVPMSVKVLLVLPLLMVGTSRTQP